MGFMCYQTGAGLSCAMARQGAACSCCEAFKSIRKRLSSSCCLFPGGPWALFRRGVKRNTARCKGRDGGRLLVAEEELGEHCLRCPPVHRDVCLELSVLFPALSPTLYCLCKQLLGRRCSSRGLGGKGGKTRSSSELCSQGTVRAVALRSVHRPWLKLACRFSSYREDRLSRHEHRRSHTAHGYIRLVSLGKLPENRDSSQQGPGLLIKRHLSLKGYSSG